MSDAGQKKRGFFGRLFARGEAEPETPLPPTELAATQAQLADQVADGHRMEPLADPAARVSVPEVASTAATAAEIVVTALAPVPPVPEPQAEKRSWFQRLKDGLTKTSSKLSDGITGLFTKRRLDSATLDDLEDLLIQADLGVETATRITDTLSKGRYQKGMSAEDVKSVLSAEVERVLGPVAKPLVVSGQHKPHVILVVGVNGSGKTTTIGKLAEQLRRSGKSVIMAAGDTFRAAAVEQLKVWGERTSSPVITRPIGSDASGLAYDALKEAQTSGRDVLLIDTAGRLQNKQGLMDELEKVVRVLRKLDPSAPHDVLLVLDATTGQNAMSQVEVFRERAGVTGLVMTKLDGTARGGILVAIAARHAVPVHAIGVGEGVEDLQPFIAGDFARAIAGS